MIEYIELDFSTRDTNTAEILIALLSQLNFDSFEETDRGFRAFIERKHYNEQEVKDLLQEYEQLDFSFSEKIISPRNWNAEWEQSFQPVQVEDFCLVRATFHRSKSNVKHEIVIDPKMAFGTGHHASTFLMIKAMKDMDFVDKKVLDFGCGTGILAILASKLGAKKIDAIDNNIWAYHNTLENIELNKAANIEAAQADEHFLSGKMYNIILANLNKNLLLEHMQLIYNSITAGACLPARQGEVLLSGILNEDEKEVAAKAIESDFKLARSLQHDGWSTLHLIKK